MKPDPDLRLRGTYPPLFHSSTPASLPTCSWHTMIAVLGDHRVDHHAVTGQTLFDDARRKLRHGDTGARFTSPLLALDHTHEPLRGLAIQHFAFVVADDRGLLPAALAVFVRARDDFLLTRQIIRQRPSSRMRLALTLLRHRPTLGFGFHFLARGGGFFSVSSSSCRLLSVSLRGPKNWMRCCRKSSCSCSIFNCAQCSSRCDSCSSRCDSCSSRSSVAIRTCAVGAIVLGTKAVKLHTTRNRENVPEVL